MPQPVLPAPRTWAAGPVLAPWLRADVSDAVALLSRPPAFAGQQTATVQSAGSGTVTPVTLDTDVLDSRNGHLPTGASAANYYGMFPGWYLCEAAVPFPAASGAGVYTQALIGGVQNGGALAWYGGGYMGVDGTHQVMPVAAKLMLMEKTGTLGGGANDYIACAALQNSAGSLTLVSQTSPTVKVPQMTARWVAAVSGTAGLPVPANPAWPVPPSYVTSAFLNANVRDAIRFLIYPPLCEVYYTGPGTLASQASLPTATGTAVSLGGTTVDSYSAYSGSTWTAPVAGVYFCYGCVNVATVASQAGVAAGLTVTSANYNGGTAITMWGGVQSPPASTLGGGVMRRRLRLNAGDTIALAGFQNNTAATAVSLVSGQAACRLITVWQGA